MKRSAAVSARKSCAVRLSPDVEAAVDAATETAVDDAAVALEDVVVLVV